MRNPPAGGDYPPKPVSLPLGRPCVHDWRIKSDTTIYGQPTHHQSISKMLPRPSGTLTVYYCTKCLKTREVVTPNKEFGRKAHGDH